MTKNSLMAVSVMLGLNLDLGRNGLESKVRFSKSIFKFDSSTLLYNKILNPLK